MVRVERRRAIFSAQARERRLIPVEMRLAPRLIRGKENGASSVSPGGRTPAGFRIGAGWAAPYWHFGHWDRHLHSLLFLPNHHKL